MEAGDGHFYVVKFSNNPQHRRILVREHSPLDRLRRPDLRAELRELFARPSGAFASHALAQRPIGSKQVVIRERRRLIQDLMIHVLYLINE